MNTTATMTDAKDAPGRISGRKLAYLVSSYPAFSHTFLLNEVCELRKLGFTIDVASINEPWSSSDGVTARESGEIERTFYIKSMKRSEAALRLLTILATHPAAALRGLGAVLRLDPRNLEASGYALFYLAEALLLGDWLRRRGHSHLHIHFGGPVATVGMLASAAWKLPYSLMIHGPEEFYDVEKSYLRAKLERARFVLCISDYCRSQVMKVCGPAHWNKFHVVRLGVDPEVFVPSRSRKETSRLEIVCVGRLVPAKGQMVLLRAISDLVSRGYSLRARLVGDGEQRSALEAFVRERGLASTVLFEGARNHEATREILGAADIFVLASFAEGLPVALMEAMAMEIPCVSTYVGAIPELIRDGVDGVLVPASSDRALASALERLIADPELRQRLARSGRRRVQDLYDLERNVHTLAVTLGALLPEQTGITS